MRGMLLKMLARLVLICGAMLCAISPAAADTVASATSPDGRIAVRVALTGDGIATYEVDRLGAKVIGESQLGFLFTDAPQIRRGMSFVSQQTSITDERWTQPWGEWASMRNHYRELRVVLRETANRQRQVAFVFRIFDHGVGFRTEFPQQDGFNNINIAEELTQFRIAQPAEAWWSEAFEHNREEYLYHHTPMAEVGTAQTPITFKLADGTHLAIHEAALVDYAGMNIAKVEGGLFKAVLTPSATGPKVARQAPFPTPWRVLLITADAPSLYAANSMILNLNEPNKLGDVSWVKPRKYMGVWWSMHLDTESWASGPKHGATTANTRRVIDFAAANGFGGVLVEGWNKGWDGDWVANGWQFSFTEPYPDFDLPGLQAHARRNGVTLIAHHETSAVIANYEDQLGAAFDQMQRLGIDSVKTGYVSDAGGIQARGADGRINFEWHEGQVMSRHHLKVVTEAAERRIAVNPHEPIKDTGLRRTYPNWISREGQRGMEYNAWGWPKNPPSYDPTLVFTRMLAGPMDFTPGILSLKGRGDSDLISTMARQLAYYVVIHSPIQMAADLPENYEANPAGFRFIKDVAVDWEDSRVLAGEVGQYVVMARKDRASPAWFVGGLTGDAGRDQTIALDFLEPRRRYVARIYQDSPDADGLGATRANMAVSQRIVRQGDTIDVHMGRAGGFAISLIPSR